MNDAFLNTFGDIEAALRTRLGLPPRDRTAIAELIERYRNINGYWRDQAADLHHFREIRNFLTHERNGQHGYPVMVTQQSLTRLQEICLGLQDPRAISTAFCHPVVTVSLNDVLSTVLRLAYVHHFSQFPVVDSNKFKGVITENEIIRWLGHQVSLGHTTIDLNSVTVRTVIREREPEPLGRVD